MTTTAITTIPIKLGGLFYKNTAQHFAFLQAIDDVNNNTMLLDGYHLEGIVEFHETNWIIEATNILSQNPTAVIAPPTSVGVKQVSPLFTLTTTPLIGYSATASILSDTDVFPYFYRVTPDVSNLIGPIMGLFQLFKWKQAVLIHGSGAWGHGLDALVYAGNLLDISFPITIEIADDATQTEIESLLSGDALSYEVYVAHVNSKERENLFAAANKLGLLHEGNAWLGTEDIATTLSNETASTMNYMEGIIALRPKTPKTWEAQILRNKTIAMGLDMIYYAYYTYDAVMTIAHAINYRINAGDDIIKHEPLSSRDYFGNITMKSSNGDKLGSAISTLQLPPNWMMTAPLYMSGNTRKTSYELINFVNGEMEIVGEFAWDRNKVNNYFTGLLNSLFVATRNTSDIDVCISLDWTARDSDTTQWNQVDKMFFVQDRALTNYYIPQYKANTDVIRLWDTCLRAILGLDRVYSSSKAADDFVMFTWSMSNDPVIFSGNTTDIPIGALWKISEPLRVLAWLIEPWGRIKIPNNDSKDTYIGPVEVIGFLPTIWENITGDLGIISEYYYEYGLSATDAVQKVNNGEYDVALGAFTVTEERSGLVHFIQQFHGGGLKILSKKPPTESTSLMFLKPFGLGLWFAMFLTILSVAGFIYALEWDTDTFYDDEERMPFMTSFVESVTISSSVLFYTHEPPKGIHTRVFVLIFQYMILVWIAAYTANMASFLTKSSRPEPEVTEFINLYQETSLVSTLRGGYAQHILETKSVELYKICNTTDECLEFVYSEPESTEDGEPYVHVFIFDDVNIDYWTSTSDQCELVAPGDVFNSISLAFPTTYNLIPDLILSALSLEMIELWSTGVITQWIEEYIQSQSVCPEYQLQEGSDTESITMNNMGELFMFIGGFSICFCCILIAQPKFEAFCKTAMENRELQKRRTAELDARNLSDHDHDDDDDDDDDDDKDDNHKYMKQLINNNKMEEKDDEAEEDGDGGTMTTTTTQQ